MTSNNSDGLVDRIRLFDFGDETRSSNYVKSSDTEKTLGVVDTSSLENLGADGDCRVNLMTMSGVDLRKLGTDKHTGFEMTKMFAFGADSAAAFARSRTIDALVLNRSSVKVNSVHKQVESGLDYHHESCLAFEERPRG
jgi:hypothetical protein